MAKLALMNIKGEKLKDINVKDEIFAIEPNEAVMHDAIVLAQASLRSGNASTKTRTEVSGGGRKPYRQKGTGRARQGSIRAPHYVGGGVVFGPHPRSYSKKQNRKERRLAIRSAFSSKLSNIIALDALKLDAPKTKEFVKVLDALKLESKTLFIINEIDENAVLAGSNLRNVMIVDTNNINIIDILNSDNIVIEEAAIAKIEEVLS